MKCIAPNFFFKESLSRYTVIFCLTEMHTQDLNSNRLPHLSGPEYVNSHHRSKERAASAKPSKNRQFNPRINGKMPEFDEIHRAMQREMGHRKNDRMATVCKPFKLHHTNTTLRDKKIYEDMKNDEDTLNESRWPYANPRAKPKHRYSLSGMDSIRDGHSS